MSRLNFGASRAAKTVTASLLAACLTMSFDVSAQSAEDAARALKNGDYPAAYKMASKLSEGGNPDADLLLGIMHFSGLGVVRDQQKALAFYQSAAEQGQAAAMHNLGAMYYRGEGVNINYARSREWNMKAAEGGLVMAQHDYASMLRTGIGGPKDTKQAMFWYEKASRAGYANSSYQLGMMLSAGSGQNQAQSMRFLCKAASQNHQDARRALGAKIRACR